jgi:hypothetical protein
MCRSVQGGHRCGWFRRSVKRWGTCWRHATTLALLYRLEEHLVLLVFALCFPMVQLRAPTFDGLYNIFTVHIIVCF